LTRVVRERARPAWPPVGAVRFGSLRRFAPISPDWGFSRGLPIDRYYIEDFLSRHAGAPGYSQGLIRGRVLEIGEDTYTKKYGRFEGDETNRVSDVDVLHADSSNPDATIVADLVDGGPIPSNAFDCIICTQTLLLIYDVSATIRTLHRILKPNGVVLATVPGISRICRPEIDLWGDYWRFTSLSARRLFEEVFDPRDVHVEAHGNLLTAAASLYGLSAQDLKPDELRVRDRDYEVLSLYVRRSGSRSERCHRWWHTSPRFPAGARGPRSAAPLEGQARARARVSQDR
jgi:SAM-dependent methyltransferase